jgi:peptidoglycan/xylan/chitin deacetylase (PgdA/CDA1 family)
LKAVQPAGAMRRGAAPFGAGARTGLGPPSRARARGFRAAGRARPTADAGVAPDGRLPAHSPRVQIDLVPSGAIALMYHGVGEPADPAEGARYTVTLGEFEAQLEVIARAGGAMDPRRAGAGGSGVALTFDDGERSVLHLALPRLAARGWVGALFVTTAWLGRPGYLAPAEVDAFRAAGWLVGSHGDTHRFLSTLGRDELRAELARSRDRLARIAGSRPAHLSLPGGRSSPRVEEEARALGFTTFWTSTPGINAALLPQSAIRRTVVRRGDPIERFERLVRGDVLAHAEDRFEGAMRAAIRRVLGDGRYHAATGRLLDALGRR